MSTKRQANRNDKKCDVFISYSGLFGQYTAELIRELLVKIYRINKNNIFYAPDSLHKHGWPQTIQEKARSCQVGISCLTLETYNNPWILYELGAMNSEALVIPLAIDFSAKELSGLEYYTSHQIKSVVNNTIKDYQPSTEDIKSLLEKMLIEMEDGSDYIKDCIERIDDVGFKGFYSRDRDNKKYFENIARKIKEAYNRFNKTYRFFISRPMQGYSESDSLTDLLSKLVSCREDVCYSRNNNNLDLSDAKIIGLERIDNIRKSGSFVLIYPKITNEERPSSCLIELGAALSMNKDVRVFYKEDARLPSFLEKWENGEKIFKESYDNDERLEALLSEYIK